MSTGTQDPPLYHPIEASTEPMADPAQVANATALLVSLPARELMSQIDRTPGRHLAQLGEHLHAPRSRYWRVVKILESEGLVRSVKRHRAHLFFPTPLGIHALQTVRRAGLDPRPKARRNVRDFPSLIIYPRGPGTP